MPRVVMDWFWSHEIPLPPPSEQHRIVELLDQFHVLRMLRREGDAKAARILPTLFLRMFGDPATNPMHFRKKRLGEIVKLRSGEFLASKDMAPDGKFPVYGGNGISGRHDRYLFEDRKVILGRVGVYCGAVHYSEPRSWVTDNALYVAEKMESLEDYYLVAALKQANLNQYAGRAGQPLISGNRVYPVEILIPPEHLQASFSLAVARVSAVDDIRSAVISRMNRLWSLLMGRAFSSHLTGEWRQAHFKDLSAEMEQQARILQISLPETQFAAG